MTHTQKYEDFEKQIQNLKKENAELKAALAERDRILGTRDGRSDFKPLFKDEAEVYRKLFDQAGYGITLVDLRTGKLSLFNKKAHEDLGYTAEEFKGLVAQDVVAESEDTIQKNMAEVRKKEYATYEQKMRKKDGEIRHFIVSAASIRIEGKRYYLVLRADITERKHLEKKLVESEEKYRLVVENAHDSIFVTRDGFLKFCNQRFLVLAGYSKAELFQMPLIDLIHPEDRDKINLRARKRRRGEAVQGNYSFRMINKQKQTLWVESSVMQVEWEGRPSTLVFYRDITLQKQMEARLLQANKMEAIGTLAGGIAHDFNNLLMSIQGNASLMLLESDVDHPRYERLRNIEKLVIVGSDLTKQLLGVAKGGKYEVKPTNLNTLLDAGSDLFGRTRKEINIHKKFEKNIWPADVDRSQIDQVLLNLNVNAWHAMPGGGDLYLETKNVILDDYYTQPYEVPAGRYVRISVTDTGVGMDEVTCKRVFDPFFTTKEMGRGTGLGLASAYGIIKNHNGIINAYSEKGKGSTFNIYLPVSDKEVMEETASISTIQQGTETLLFVDDEATIVEVGDKILKKLGYHVITAKSGSEAIEIFSKQWDQIHLVILDMIMPQMGGGETFDRLKVIDPSVKVLLSSGYSINGQAQNIMDRGCMGFMQKPFNIMELSKKLRQILDDVN